MIRFALTCARDHAFESWFANAAAYDRLADQGHVTCPVCGSTKVAKALMAPALSAGRVAPAPTAPPQAGDRDTGGAARMAQALAELRREVEENAEYVGRDFATEARAIHEGDARGRAIWGEARPEDARALLDEGIGVAPLPFAPRRKMN